MEQADSDVPVPEPENFSAGGAKRASDVAASDLGAQPRRKARIGATGRVADEMRRIAEIVLVLSALGKMRGGRSPSAVERELMAEAREKLARVCEPVAPKDLIPSEAVRSLMDDLGYNKVRDARLGFRPPKVSIAEKVSLTKRKVDL